jgi:trk system potassium uptake protein
MARRTFGVIGLGRFGSAMAQTLVELGQEVIGIDSSEEPVRKMAEVLSQVVRLDAMDERALRAAGIADVDVAVISIGENVEASIIVVMQMEELGIGEVIAKAVTPLHGRVLHKLGVKRVIYPERDMAIRVAHSLVVPNSLDYIELSRDFSIVELPAPREWVGKSLKELALRPRLGLTLIAIRRRAPDGRETTNIGPSAEDRIDEGDILALLGDNARLAQLDRVLGPNASTRGR